MHVRVRGGRAKASVECRTSGPVLGVGHLDQLEASDLVSDWLIQTCCKRMWNKQKPSVILLLGDSKAAHQLWGLRQEPHMGLQSKNRTAFCDVLHGARPMWRAAWCKAYVTCCMVQGLCDVLHVLHGARPMWRAAWCKAYVTCCMVQGLCDVLHGARPMWRAAWCKAYVTCCMMQGLCDVLHGARPMWRAAWCKAYVTCCMVQGLCDVLHGARPMWRAAWCKAYVTCCMVQGLCDVLHDARPMWRAAWWKAKWHLCASPQTVPQLVWLDTHGCRVGRRPLSLSSHSFRRWRMWCCDLSLFRMLLKPSSTCVTPAAVVLSAVLVSPSALSFPTNSGVVIAVDPQCCPQSWPRVR